MKKAVARSDLKLKISFGFIAIILLTLGVIITLCLVLRDPAERPDAGRAGLGLGVLLIGSSVWIFQGLRAGARQLKESEERFKQLSNTIPQLVFMTTPNGECDFTNWRWTEYTGLSLSHTRAQGWLPTLHPDETEVTLQKWITSRKSGEPFEVEARIRSAREDYRWHLVRITPLFVESGEKEPGKKVSGWIGSCTDIEDHKRNEAALEEALQVRDEFLSIASHELKTPLTILATQAQLMKKIFTRDPTFVLAPDKIERLADLTDLQIARLSRIIEDILDVSRFRSGQLSVRPEPIELTALVAEVIERLAPQFENSGTQVTVTSQSTVHGVWDRCRIEQVLINLLTNAIKYGGGNSVDIKILTVQRAGKAWVTIEVEDHGIGIALEDREKIFQRFERSAKKTKIQGLGLGLYIVRQILNAHGGDVRVESELGRGSRFVVQLPLQAEKSEELQIS